MKKLLVSMNYLLFIPLLSSCSPTPMEENISFLNEHEAAFCYYGKETGIFDKLNNYYDLSIDEFPENSDSFLGVMVDVENKRKEISNVFLNKIYAALSRNSYVYIMFFNYNKDLSILENSGFAQEMTELNNVGGNMVMLYNSGNSDSVRYTTYGFGDISGKEYTSDDYLKSSFSQYATEVKKALMDL